MVFRDSGHLYRQYHGGRYWKDTAHRDAPEDADERVSRGSAQPWL